ncbi:MAG: LPXTG cell wall anchor domain-containing protein [Oscillospiraceae bacterium]|jgi:LPXTG-motif cell wall-anchored protein|nr:LPXTG cell wall anchor domain-containing protein [Oscillospiraceae bacterium]
MKLEVLKRVLSAVTGFMFAAMMSSASVWAGGGLAGRNAKNPNIGQNYGEFGNIEDGLNFKDEAEYYSYYNSLESNSPANRSAIGDYSNPENDSSPNFAAGNNGDLASFANGYNAPVNGDFANGNSVNGNSIVPNTSALLDEIKTRGNPEFTDIFSKAVGEHEGEIEHSDITLIGGIFGLVASAESHVFQETDDSVSFAYEKKDYGIKIKGTNADGLRILAYGGIGDPALYACKLPIDSPNSISESKPLDLKFVELGLPEGTYECAAWVIDNNSKSCIYEKAAKGWNVTVLPPVIADTGNTEGDPIVYNQGNKVTEDEFLALVGAKIPAGQTGGIIKTDFNKKVRFDVPNSTPQSTRDSEEVPAFYEVSVWYESGNAISEIKKIYVKVNAFEPSISYDSSKAENYSVSVGDSVDPGKFSEQIVARIDGDDETKVDASLLGVPLEFDKVGDQSVILSARDKYGREALPQKVDVKVVGFKRFEDTASGVFIEAPEGLFDEESVLTVRTIQSGTDEWSNIINNKLDEKHRNSMENIKLYDIVMKDKNDVNQLEKGGDSINDKTFWVYIPIPNEGFDIDEVYALYVGSGTNDDEDQKSERWYDESSKRWYCKFKATHLSLYGALDPYSFKDVANIGNNTGNGNSGNESNSENSDPSNPKTGDSDVALMVLAGLGISVAGVIMVDRKRRENQKLVISKK